MCLAHEIDAPAQMDETNLVLKLLGEDRDREDILLFDVPLQRNFELRHGDTSCSSRRHSDRRAASGPPCTQASSTQASLSLARCALLLRLRSSLGEHGGQGSCGRCCKRIGFGRTGRCNCRSPCNRRRRDFHLLRERTAVSKKPPCHNATRHGSRHLGRTYEGGTRIQHVQMWLRRCAQRRSFCSRRATRDFFRLISTCWVNAWSRHHRTTPHRQRVTAYSRTTKTVRGGRNRTFRYSPQNARLTRLTMVVKGASAMLWGVRRYAAGKHGDNPLPERKKSRHSRAKSRN